MGEQEEFCCNEWRYEEMLKIILELLLVIADTKDKMLKVILELLLLIADTKDKEAS